ncbi:MAG: hypothetical protein DME26_21960, partial [Verrucomicrobia bacterium]
MQNPEKTPEKVGAVSEIFAAWLQERQAGGRRDFESICASHPESAQALQAVYSAFQLGQAAATSRSFQQTLREQFGDEAEVTVKLEEGVPLGVPPSGSPVRELAKAVTPSQGSRYSLEDEVARGGMGVIWRVRDRDLARTLAMKVMTGAPGSSQQAT